MSTNRSHTGLKLLKAKGWRPENRGQDKQSLGPA